MNRSVRINAPMTLMLGEQMPDVFVDYLPSMVLLFCQMLNQELRDLQKLSAHLRQKLMESMYRHEYFREAEDLEKWIAEQMQTATSEDFGQDYEHLLVCELEPES